MSDDDDQSAQRYVQLPPAARKWLETPRRAEDWEKFDAAMKFYDRAQTNGKFLLWLIGTLIGLFVSVVVFGDSVLKAIGWFKRP